MRNFIIFSVFFLLSCKASERLSNDAIISEILSYKLEKVDTLVDIGCGQGFFSREIAHYNPNLFLILEDLPKLSKFVKKRDTTNCEKVDTKQEVKNWLRNSKYVPNVENKYLLIIGKDDSIPISTGTCKRVLCRQSLHEFKNKEIMAFELSRILSIDGILTIVETEPKYLGEKDIYCLNNYLTKQNIVNILKPLKLRNDTSIINKGTRTNIYNFIK